ncbi:MAG: PilZ domain-containing protein [Nitrospiraceae bacterium]|nr:PilZ domain-containing protein [Nitrospiraceae bacterium]
MEERRSNPRTCLSIPLKCLCRLKEDEDLSMSIEGVTSDMSETGLRFYTGKNLSDCSKIEIRSPNWSGAKKGKIMWQAIMADMGIYQVGVSLQHEDPEFAGRMKPAKTF